MYLCSTLCKTDVFNARCICRLQAVHIVYNYVPNNKTLQQGTWTTTRTSPESAGSCREQRGRRGEGQGRRGAESGLGERGAGSRARCAGSRRAGTLCEPVQPIDRWSAATPNIATSGYRHGSVLTDSTYIDS